MNHFKIWSFHQLEFFTYKRQCWRWLQLKLIQPIFLLLEFQSVRSLQFFLRSYYLDILSSLKILLQFGQFLQLNIKLWKDSMLYATWNMVILVTDPWRTIGIFFLEFFTMTFCRWFYIGLGLGTFLAKTNISLSIKNMPISTDKKTNELTSMWYNKLDSHLMLWANSASRVILTVGIATRGRWKNNLDKILPANRKYLTSDKQSWMCMNFMNLNFWTVRKFIKFIKIIILPFLWYSKKLRKLKFEDFWNHKIVEIFGLVLTDEKIFALVEFESKWWWVNLNKLHRKLFFFVRSITSHNLNKIL